ncbi:F-box domain containing protein [Parasponia andersonii]|uniref:F-box domain containing protein n=1 Tax=Parasponia andersonii TaxID=3476 RepID=A0A2P5B0F7_PARAD|nr:F-box domain containing protein [Parasponia andersonii]
MEAFDPSVTLPFSYTFTTATSSRSSGTIASPNNIITTGSSWMDGRIWSKLPQRLLDRVIAFLTPPAFFRARCVCKRWYGLLFSPTFLELYLQVSPRRYWFLFFKQKSLNNSIYRSNDNNSSAGDPQNDNRSSSPTTCEGFLFDPYDLSWYRISFPTLLPPGFSPAASSDGLVCWVSYEAGPKTLILCNPMVGSLTPLPPTLRSRLFPSVGLAVTPTSIDVTMAGDDLISPYAVKNLTAESFHMDGGGFYSIWGTSSSLPRLCSFESGKMVHVEGRFYCMNYSPYSILAHDISSNSWWKIQAPMRRFLRSPNLVESRGKLLLVAAVEKSQLNVPKSLRLWGLQSCGTTWVELERMPQQLYVQFAELENGNGFHCVGNGEFIAIMIPGTEQKAVLFDMSRKRWHWIPPCPYVNGGVGRGGGELHGFAYEPRLATPVTGLLDQLTLPFQSYNNINV